MKLRAPKHGTQARSAAPGATKRNVPNSSRARVSIRAAQQLKERGALGNTTIVQREEWHDVPPPPPPGLPPPRLPQPSHVHKREEPRSQRAPEPSSDLLVSLTSATRKNVHLEAECAKWEAEASRLRAALAESTGRVESHAAELEAMNRAIVQVAASATVPGAFEEERSACWVVHDAARAEAERERTGRDADRAAAQAIVEGLRRRLSDAIAQYEAAMTIVDDQDSLLRRAVEALSEHRRQQPAENQRYPSDKMTNVTHLETVHRGPNANVDCRLDSAPC